MSDLIVKDGLLDPDDLDGVLEAIKAKGWQYGWKSNTNLPMSHWHCGFAGEKRLNRDDISDEMIDISLPVFDIWAALQPIMMPGCEVPIRAYANAHTYGVEGYPHTDSTHEVDRTCVVYLNREWSRNWGGETATYQGNDILCSVAPKWGRAFSFPSHMWHAARGVTRICPDARVTLVYKARPA